MHPAHIHTRAEVTILDNVERGRLTIKDAADKMGVTRQTVYQRLRKLGMSFPHQPGGRARGNSNVKTSRDSAHCRHCEILLAYVPEGSRDGICLDCWEDMARKQVLAQREQKIEILEVYVEEMERV